MLYDYISTAKTVRGETAEAMHDGHIDATFLIQITAFIKADPNGCAV
jgi:hypothetical protein